MGRQIRMFEKVTLLRDDSSPSLNFQLLAVDSQIPEKVLEFYTGILERESSHAWKIRTGRKERR